MGRLFSYCLPYDDGAAPNPFWGTCTLAICKPAIRRVAEPGDWVVGTGSANSPVGDVSGQVVYAMQVSESLTMAEYDTRTRTHLRKKVPNLASRDRRWMVGDSLYDFSGPEVQQRLGFHDQGNRATDLGGRNVLLSNHFFYFGDRPVPLPPRLRPIVKQGQGHRSEANQPFLGPFTEWVETLGYPPGSVVGQPQMWPVHSDESLPRACAIGRQQEAEADLEGCEG